MNNLNLASPWVQYVNKIEKLLGDDPDVEVKFDEDSVKLEIYVTDNKLGSKSQAIKLLLPDHIKFGNVTLDIIVVPANADKEPTFSQIVQAAFMGNPHFSRVATEQHGLLESFDYGLFNNETIQYYTDDMTEYGGFVTTTPASIAEEIIDTPTGFYFSTEV